MIENEWKIIWKNGGEPELYDLSADPNETADLAGHPNQAAVLARMLDRAEAYRAVTPPAETGREQDGNYDGEALEALRALGYL